MEIIFRKVLIKDRLPKDKGNYSTNIGNIYFINSNNLDLKGYPDNVLWWLEEITLPGIELTGTKIDELIDQYFCSESQPSDMENAIEDYDKWLRDFVLAVTPK